MSTVAGIDESVLERIVELAARREAPISTLSMDEIAAGLGVSRMTLYRRIGSRDALHTALRERGIDPGEEVGAAERALAATAELIREVGVAALTLEAVAARAGCALPTIYAQFGGRSGLLMAVFERHSPIPVLKRALEDVAPGDPAAFRRCISRLYGIIVATVTREQALLRALLSEALRDPGSDVGQFLVTRYLPSIVTHIMPWIADHQARGVIRPLPLVLVGQQFAGPLLMHLATRPLVEASGAFDLPPLDDVCDEMADMFCRAVEAHPAPRRLEER